MKWQAIEDKICCLIFIKNHVNNNFSIHISVQEAIDYGVEKAEGSIKMKFSNISQICFESGVKLLTTISRLYNYSEQCFEEFRDVRNFTQLQIMEELHKIKHGLID